MTGNFLVEQYKKIWNEYQNTEVNKGTKTSNHNLLDRGFTFQFDEEITDVDVLFVGINPSYAGNPEEPKFYTQEQALGHKYFKSFSNIQEELKSKYNRNITWTHMDLLVFRETSQKFISETLYKSEDGLNFIMAQLELGKKILEHISPKVMVVSNTQARAFLGGDRYYSENKDFNIWMGYDFKFDHELGTLRVVNHNELDPFVFFTSMLSGQSALDKGSKERLTWHINHILKNHPESSMK